MTHRGKGICLVTFKYLQMAFVIVAFSCVSLVGCTVSTSPGEVDITNEGEEYLSDLQGLSSVELAVGENLRVVATTTIVGDVVSKVGGTAIELTTLLPFNADPHAYELTPADLRAVSDAHVVFINGFGLEEFLEEMLKNVGTNVPFVSLSEGIDPLILGDEHQDDEIGEEESEAENVHGGFDPHVWFDPTNVMQWTERVAQTLSILDPGNRTLYDREAEAYQVQLQDLDEWIFDRVSLIPPEDRKLVTDHRVFDYFATRYGFDVIGAVIPVYSSAAEPSAKEIAELQLQVRDLGVQTLFVGVTVNPNSVQAIVEDTGVEVVSLYTGSLSDPQGPAGSYIDFMKFNVESIVEALQNEGRK